MEEVKDPILSFNVFPGLSFYKKKAGHYLPVHLFEGQRDMQLWAARHQCTLIGETTGATVLGHTIIRYHPAGSEKKPFKLRDIGCMLFYEGNVGPRVVAHEAVHAALRWYDATNRNKKLANYLTKADKSGWAEDAEEDLAYAIGDITSQIYNKFYEEGIIC